MHESFVLFVYALIIFILFIQQREKTCPSTNIIRKMKQRVKSYEFFRNIYEAITSNKYIDISINNEKILKEMKIRENIHIDHITIVY